MIGTGLLAYQNPVFAECFADRFVLQTGSGYYVCGTGAGSADERQFPVLHSTDLVHGQTLEGPTLRLHNGQYTLLDSGGNWDGGTYGVEYAVADPVPGHCSVTIGPDGKEVVVYHAWDTGITARRLCIDPLVWDENRLRRADLDTAACINLESHKPL